MADLNVAVLIAGKESASGPINKVVEALGNLSKAATSPMRAVGSLVNTLGRIGLASGGIAATVSVVERVRNALTAPVEAASDLNETVNKVDVVFGDAAASVKAFASNSATALGQSKQEALAAAAAYGNLFTTMGIGQQEAAGMSTALVKAASDLGSFHNVDPSDVLEKLRSGLVGESEPLRALGILLNEDMVKAQAMAMGLADANGELSEAAKVQTRYALILAQTGSAQGDFARTSSGLANAGRIINAVLADASAQIGDTFLPAVANAASTVAQTLPRALTAIQPVVEGFGRTLAGAIQSAIPVIESLPRYIEIARAAFAALPEPVKQLLPTLASMAPVAMTAAGALSILAAAVGAVASPIGLAIAGIATLTVAWQNNWLGIRDIVNAVLPAVAETIVNLVGGILDWWDATLPKMQKTVEVVLGAIKTFWDNHGAQIVAIVQTVWGLIESTVGRVLANLADVVEIAMDIIQGDWDGAWQAFQRILASAWEQIVDTVSAAAKIVIGLVGIVAKALGKEDLTAGWQQAVDDIASGAKVMTASLAGVGDQAEDTASRTESGAARIKNALQGALFAASSLGPKDDVTIEALRAEKALMREAAAAAQTEKAVKPVFSPPSLGGAGGKSPLQRAVEAAKDKLDDLKSALSDAKNRLQDLVSTPIKGERAVSDKVFALEQQILRLQVQRDRLEAANARGRNQRQIVAIDRQIEQLELQKRILEGEARLKFDPLHRQIENLANPQQEKPFSELVQSIKDTRKEIDTLDPQVKHAESVWKDLEKQLKAVELQASKTATALGRASTAAGMAPVPASDTSPATPGFAQGGSFPVGGSGGTDSQLVQFWATPGERVTVTPPGRASGGLTIQNLIGTMIVQAADGRISREGLEELRREIRHEVARLLTGGQDVAWAQGVRA